MATLKQPAGRGRSDSPSKDLTPAWRYLLLVGSPAPGRVPGWLGLFQQSMPARPDITDGWDHRRRGDQLWARYGPMLTADAERHGFAAFWGTKQRPSGPAFDQWCERFLSQRY